MFSREKLKKKWNKKPRREESGEYFQGNRPLECQQDYYTQTGIYSCRKDSKDFLEEKTLILRARRKIPPVLQSVRGWQNERIQKYPQSKLLKTLFCEYFFFSDSTLLFQSIHRKALACFVCQTDNEKNEFAVYVGLLSVTDIPSSQNLEIMEQ